jgi:hypothetical protein
MLYTKTKLWEDKTEVRKFMSTKKEMHKLKSKTGHRWTRGLISSYITGKQENADANRSVRPLSIHNS